MPLEGDVVHFVRQLVEGLAYLHERNIAHLDIKVSSTHKRSMRTCHASLAYPDPGTDAPSEISDYFLRAHSEMEARGRMLENFTNDSPGVVLHYRIRSTQYDIIDHIHSGTFDIFQHVINRSNELGHRATASIP